MANDYEKKWQKVWAEEKIYEPDLSASRRKASRPFYNLMMFPYPSAEGMHVGNAYAFTGSDVYGRFKRMQGYDVFEPIGLDGFGIHAENYALKIGAHPVSQAKITEKNFYRQFEMIGNGFAWDERLETYDPKYYKWTQWIFVQLFKNGLAYRKKQAVNWCPSCKTVLADEQVVSGKCERCGSEVIKKDLEQWFFKITKYAERLLKNLEKIDWSERVKIAQRGWIGKSEGALIKFKVKGSKLKVNDVEVFTTRPDTLFGATYLVLSPEHQLVESLKLKVKNWPEVKKYVKKAKLKLTEERIAEKQEKTGVELKGIKAINLANKKEIPIFVADYVLSSYGTGAIMAVPAHDERDFEFAKKFKLPIIPVISNITTYDVVNISNGPYVGEGILINSGKFSGMDSEKAKVEITKFVAGKKQVQYHLRDWLISRQRYWGPPIPMIYCPVCAKASAGKENAGWQPVPEKDLPVELPYVKEFRPQGKGESPLATVKSFYEVKCPACGNKARRETDVSDTFLDSAWYFLRYPSLNFKNSKLEIGNLKLEIPWNQEITRRWLPVNMYIGGAEHSVLHLLYSRFLTMFFYDLKMLHFEEPFTKFRAHGLLIKEGAKMSKSKGNVINPDEYIKKFGADVLRMYLMFLAPFEQGGDFHDSGILGVKRFLERVYKLKIPKSKIQNRVVEKLLHQTIKKVTEDIESLNYNTAISALMILFNGMEKNQQSLNPSIFQSFLKLLAPFAPYLTEEIWRGVLGNKKSVHLEAWPEYDPKVLKEDKFELVIQINGRVRGKVLADIDIFQKDAEKLALNQEKIKIWLKGKQMKKIIFVKNRLMNIVVE